MEEEDSKTISALARQKEAEAALRRVKLKERTTPSFGEKVQLGKLLWPIVSWVLLSFFLIGPGLVSVISILKQFNPFLWIAIIFLGILILKQRRR